MTLALRIRSKLGAVMMVTLGSACDPAEADVDMLESASDVGKADGLGACSLEWDVLPEHSLFIRDPRVVDDARTQGEGPLSIAHLLGEMTPEGGTVPDLGLYLRVLPDDPIVCPDAQASCLYPDVTPIDDLAAAPIKLVAIVNRLDLISEDNPVGEVRLVYQFFGDIARLQRPMRPGDPDPRLVTFLNFEFDLSAVRDESGQPIARETWAAWFHRLDALELGSPAYLDELQAIVHRVVRRNAAPDRVNGSALRVLRRSFERYYPSRDIWALSSMKLAPADDLYVQRGLVRAGAFVSSGLERTPPGHANGWWNAPAYQPNQPWSLISVLVDNEAAITSGDFDFERRPPGTLTATAPITRADTIDASSGSGRWLPSQSMYGHNRLPDGWTATRWDALTTAFGALTCNGCHGFHTGTSGNHIEPRVDGEASMLSDFVMGTELPRRVVVARELLCASEDGP